MVVSVVVTVAVVSVVAIVAVATVAVIAEAMVTTVAEEDINPNYSKSKSGPLKVAFFCLILFRSIDCKLAFV